MKNKFEALATFQGWPKDWQRLCAEFWAESDMGEQVRVWTTADKLEAAAKLMQPQPQRASKVFRRLHWTAREDDYLQKCVAEHAKLGDAVRQFLALHPGRSTDSIRRRAWGMQKGTVK